MLRNLILLRSSQLALGTESILTQQFPALIISKNQLTSLCRFSSSSLQQQSSDDDTLKKDASPNEGTEPKESAASLAASLETGIDPETLSPAMKRVHDNSALWRKWLEGKIDEKLQEPRSNQRPIDRRVPNLRTPYNNPNQQHRGHQAQQNPNQQPKWRAKDPSKDWKHAARTARSAEERITNIIVPDSDPTTATTAKGRFGWLGSATDAPKINSAISAKAEEASPNRIHPHRLFFPGQNYSPDELDPYKVKPFAGGTNTTGRLYMAKNTVPARYAAQFGDFRNGHFLSQFVSEMGKILPRRSTRLPAKLHRAVAREIKLARQMALLSPTERTFGFRRGSFANARPPRDAQQQGSNNGGPPRYNRGGGDGGNVERSASL